MPVRSHRLVAAGAGLALAAALTACSGDNAPTPQQTATSQAPSSATPSGSAANPAPSSPAGTSAADADLAHQVLPVSVDAALQTAKTTFDGTVTKIGVEHDRTLNAWVYRIDTQKGTEQHELAIDATSGKVLANKQDTESGPPQAVDPRKFSPNKAMDAALKVTPGTVKEWTLEHDDGAERYKVEVRSGAKDEDVIVDTATGKATPKP